MKIRFTTFFDEQRECWRVRFRGAGLDNKLNVPFESFYQEGVSPQSRGKRAENVALAWALLKRAELLQPTSGSVEPLSLRQIFDLMKSVNPDQASAATWERNTIHIRNLERLPASEPLGNVLPERVDGRLASMYRNERQAEGAAPRTIGGELTFLMRLLRFGFEEAASATGMTAVRLTRMPKITIIEQEMVALT